MNDSSSCPSTLSDDGFLGQRLAILQPKKGYRAGIDAVMLAASVATDAGAHVLDLGAGVGVASLCLASRSKKISVTGLEVQRGLVEIASENAGRNQLGGRVRIVEGSVGEKAAVLQTKQVAYGSFDHVMTNPPFYDADTVLKSPDTGKAMAHAFDGTDLEQWVHVACAMARPKGTVTFVHRADALPALLAQVQGRLGALVAFPLWPDAKSAGQKASRILLQGVKGSRAPFELSSGLVLHTSDGGFTDAASAILRDGEGLSLRSA